MPFYDIATADLTTVELINNSGAESLQLQDAFTELSYYEDITIPAVSATIAMSDAMGYLNRFPINGNETLNLNFKTRGFDYLEGIDIRDLKSYNIGARTNTSDRTVAYPLQFTTKVALDDSKVLVEGSYEGRISDIVRRLGQAAGFELPFAVEETEGLYHYVGTGDTIFETIRKLAKEAKSLVYPSSAFVFFQDRFGYKFVTLNSLFAQSVREENEFYYSYQNRPNNTIPPNQLIEDLSFLKNSDVIDGMRSGLYGGETLSIDPLRKSTYKSEFDYFGKGFKETGPHLSNSRVQNPLYSFAKNSKKAHSNCIISDLKDFNPRPYIQQNNVREDIYVKTRHQYIDRQTSLFAQSNNYGLEITIPGTSSIRVGDVVNINIPEPSAAVEDAQKLDKYLKGKYLVSSARHIVGVQGQYTTILTLIKDSFESEVFSTESTFGD